MSILLSLVALGLVLWNRTEIARLAQAIVQAERELAILRQGRAAPAPQAVGHAFVPVSPASAESRTPAAPAPTEAAPPVPPARAQYERSEPFRPPFEAKQAQKDSVTIDLERQFGARLPVWIGGIALALAGFFLVRYTIEIGLLSETVRVVLGGVFGLALIGAGCWVGTKTFLANGERIAQALAGAGIADLYASLFVATTLYELISPVAGFVGLAAVTVGAVVLALRHGVAIAVLGLVGGFLTPLMTGSTEPNAPLLFGYIYCLLAGFFAVIKNRGWWYLATPTVLAGFVWVPIWVHTGFDAEAAIWPMLFAIAVSATVAFASHEQETDDDAETFDLTNPMTLLRYLSLGGGILATGAVSSLAGFEPLDWSLFGLLTLGAITLAALKPRTYSLAPPAALAMSFAMFAAWALMRAEPTAYAVTIVAFGLLHGTSGYALLWRSPIKSVWGTVAAGAPLGYFLLAYAKLHDVFTAQFPVWGTLAGMLALLAVKVTRDVLNTLDQDDSARAWLLGLFSAAAAAFVTLGLAIELSREHLYVAVAGEVLAVAWLSTRVPIAALKSVAAALLMLFVLLIAPEVATFVGLAMAGLVDADLVRVVHVAVDLLALHLSAAALMLLSASVVLRRQSDGALAKILEGGAAALAGATIYVLVRQIFHPDGYAFLAEPSFIERGVTTNAFFLAGLGAFWLGRRFDRTVAAKAGLVFSVIALFRVVYFDLLVLNPAWSHQFVGEWPLVNGLLLALALPILWTVLVARETRAVAEHDAAALALHAFGFVLLFTFVTLSVRQLYWGAYLDGGSTFESEIYAYSAAWLLLGVGLLVAGTILKSQAVRVASLVVMLVTVGKVFLIDASSLEGLYRIGSFFGLGVTLIALSWFYTRYVFATKDEAAATTLRGTAR